MKFDELDVRMRVFETAHDYKVLPGIYIVARIDGRGFTKLTRERHEFDAPYDVRVRDMMVATTTHLMDCGFRSVYGYTQSDEISILFHRDVATFGRKLRKFESVLAGEASARFTLALGALAAFDGRVSQLPNEGSVVDYFRWRHEDAHRNALHGHCYWLLRGQGQSDVEASRFLDGKSVAERNELLLANGIQFDELPGWQKRGVGVAWKSFAKVCVNPKTGEAATSERRRLEADYDLPTGSAYDAYLRAFVAEATPTDVAP